VRGGGGLRSRDGTACAPSWSRRRREERAWTAERVFPPRARPFSRTTFDLRRRGAWHSPFRSTGKRAKVAHVSETRLESTNAQVGTAIRRRRGVSMRYLCASS